MKLFNRFWWIILVTTIFVSGFYIFIKISSGLSGYPLDDAWIHQTYAKNLALTGQFAFNPGQPTSGSTAPLWTFLLAIGYFIQVPNEIWSALLGTAVLFVCGWVVFNWMRKEVKDVTKWLLAGSLLVVTEWHLVWASVSGMETILQAAIFVFVILECLRSDPKWIWIGIGIGVSIWIRPDGITLLGPVVFTLLATRLHKSSERIPKTRDLIFSGLIVAVLTGGYLLFNYLLSHSVWPNTLYAKQYEYRELLTTPFLKRFSALWVSILTGTNIILLPGFLWGFWLSIKNKEWSMIAGFLWLLGYILVYSLRLPVTYQHGRYMMPLIPVFIFLSLLGYSKMRFRNYQIRFMAASTFKGIAFLVSVGFIILGARAYRIDVAAVDYLMVQPAKWIEANTKPDDLIAAHDIGALGYFSGRKVLDLAGLINPEVIPIVRDLPKVISYASGKNARYLVIFPDWYGTTSATTLKQVYSSNAPPEILQGHSNMEIFHLSE